MVNITDTFTRLYGRPPTPTEIGAMMKLKLKQEALQNPRLRERVVLEPEEETPKVPEVKSEGKKCNIREWAINCLMQDGYTKEQISHILCITIAQINYNTERQSLPRNDLIKPKSK
jgi:hypothetical protein